MEAPDLDQPSNLSETLEAAKPQLSAIPSAQIVRRIVSRERVLELSARILASWTQVTARAEQALSDHLYADYEQRAAGLATRAWAFYSADLDLNSAYSDDARREREALAARVKSHDRRLMLWAKLAFEGDAQAEETLADIAAYHGRRDDAEDVVRMVKMFRHAHAEGMEIPVAKAEIDAAEADAKQQLDLLSIDPGSAARLLASQAYTAWHRDYDALLGLGRFLTRGEPDSLSLFPGVRMPTRRSSSDEVEVQSEAAPAEDASLAEAS